MKRTILLGVLVAIVVVWAVPATAQTTYMVRITNVSKQIISPPLVATHSWKARIFVPGNPASTELSMLAEDGDPSALAAALGGNGEVLDMAVADGPLMPGASMVFELESRGRFNRVSAVGMLVTSNDAFFGLENLPVRIARLQPGGIRFGGSGLNRQRLADSSSSAVNDQTPSSWINLSIAGSWPQCGQVEDIANSEEGCSQWA